MNIFTKLIAERLNLPEQAVDNTLRLLDEGCTIPFIARYRKERTGGLNELQIEQISEQSERLKELAKRKETIVKTIEEQDKLTPELRKRIEDSWDSTELEDLYMPYKPKRRTRAQAARELGLEPLADVIMQQRCRELLAEATKYVNDDVEDTTQAIQGAQDIIAERISEDERARQLVRGMFNRTAEITSKVVKSKLADEGAHKFSDYFDLRQPLRRCSGNRLLAIMRGQHEGVLRMSLGIDDQEATERLRRLFVRGHGDCSQIVGDAVDDAYKRLICPSIENETINIYKAKADDEAIGVFTDNLRQLLLAAPLGQKRVMGIDPGFRTGCKVVCLDSQGNLLHHDAIFPHPPQRYRMQASVTVSQLVDDYHIEAIAIGNGTASRETVDFIEDIQLGNDVQVFVVSEDGASIYSASKTARDEFPDKDVTVRGAVSIARRLMDPLAELVKIDPKSIGVGQYQHDVDQTKLKKSLDHTVEFCVNQVGVDLNTASPQLLTHVSGLGPALAQNIVDYRKANGAFSNRQQLKKVPRLGATAFTQCAGFLRITNADNPLDGSAVHPESYHIVEQMAKDQGCQLRELIGNKELLNRIELSRYVNEEVGLPTLNDIVSELDKPGRDPRGQAETFRFDERIHEIEDLEEGMILPGIVTNITKFGCFVDIGVHQDGLVHVSQMADRYVSDPTKVVHLHQHVTVKVVGIDMLRQRISLSMKHINK